jgi:thimet oligopeptidase
MKMNHLAAALLLCAGCPSPMTQVKPTMEKPSSTHPDAQALTDECLGHIAESRKVLDAILTAGAPGEASTLAPYNDIGIHLDAALAKAGLMANVHTVKEVRDAAEACEQEARKFVTELSLNRALYEAFAKVPQEALDADGKRLVAKTLLDFKRAGVDKDDATRAKIKQLDEELTLIGQEFSRNIRDDVRAIEVTPAELEGLPPDYIAAHKPNETGKVKVTTEYPDYIPFMTYAKSGEARKRLAFEFKNRAWPRNDEVLKRLLAKRHEYATTLGYPHWAAYITEDKMIRTADAVAKFIEEVAAIARPRAERDYADLLAEKKKDDPGATVVTDWEKAYYEERVKKAKYAFDSQAVRPYFDFARVQQGLLDLTAEMYGLKYVKAEVPVWHESVDVFEVMDGEKPLGRIYLDLHPRTGKYGHAAQFTMKSGVAGRQLPEGVLVCNFPDPRKTEGPALMDYDEVKTFFHEFGHLLHHVLGGHQKWIRFSGVATEWDFVEAPSQFFEEWVMDHAVLSRFARHHAAGEVIPADLVKRMRDADEFAQGTAALTQMFYASMSLQYYNQPPAAFEPTDLMIKLQGKYSKFPYMEGTHFNVNFGHIEGYSAMYYTYMWSLVIAKDLLSAFKEKGMLDTSVARKYRESILQPGGSGDAADLVKTFLGRPYSFDAFKKWLEGAG